MNNKPVTRKELVDNVLRPAFQNEDFETTLREIIMRLQISYPEVAKKLMDAAKQHSKDNEK